MPETPEQFARRILRYPPGAPWQYPNVVADITREIEKRDDETRAAAIEECARLHELIDPACDHERVDRVPGAGSMGAVIDYRDAIRKLGGRHA